MYKNVYDCFKHWYRKGGSVYLYADPEFTNVDVYAQRLGFKKEDNKYVLSYPNELRDKVFTVKSLDEKQVKSMNVCCKGNDTLIILGHVGNLEVVKQLKAGYKVLITDDQDVEKYKRKLVRVTTYPNIKEVFKEELPYQNCTPGALTWKATIKDLCNKIKKYHTDSEKYEYTTDYEDNKLFDEVYEGSLQISPDIILSQKAIENCPVFNIHGTDAELVDFEKYVLGKYDADMNDRDAIKYYMEEVKENNLNSLSIPADLLVYKPICLKRIVNTELNK